MSKDHHGKKCENSRWGYVKESGGDAGKGLMCHIKEFGTTEGV